MRIGRGLVMHRRMPLEAGLARPGLMIPFEILDRDAERFVRQRLDLAAEICSRSARRSFLAATFSAQLLDDRRRAPF
jgi:hypothetical protein